MPVKKRCAHPTVWEKILAKINFNNILLTIIGGWFSYLGINANVKQAETNAKQDTVMAKQDSAFDKIDSTNQKQLQWKQRRDSIDKMILQKLDSVLTNKHKK